MVGSERGNAKRQRYEAVFIYKAVGYPDWVRYVQDQDTEFEVDWMKWICTEVCIPSINSSTKTSDIFLLPLSSRQSTDPLPTIY